MRRLHRFLLFLGVFAVACDSWASRTPQSIRELLAKDRPIVERVLGRPIAVNVTFPGSQGAPGTMYKPMGKLKRVGRVLIGWQGKLMMGMELDKSPSWKVSLARAGFSLTGVTEDRRPIGVGQTVPSYLRGVKGLPSGMAAWWQHDGYLIFSSAPTMSPP